MRTQKNISFSPTHTPGPVCLSHELNEASEHHELKDSFHSHKLIQASCSSKLSESRTQKASEYHEFIAIFHCHELNVSPTITNKSACQELRNLNITNSTKPLKITNSLIHFIVTKSNFHRRTQTCAYAHMCARKQHLTHRLPSSLLSYFRPCPSPSPTRSRTHSLTCSLAHALTCM